MKAAFNADVVSSTTTTSSSGSSNDSKRSSSSPSTVSTATVEYDCNKLFTKKFSLKKAIGDAHLGWVLTGVVGSGLNGVDAQTDAISKLDYLIRATGLDRQKTLHLVFHRRTEPST